MEWLNYHHLHYFWVAAREGGVAAAARRLRLAPPTISEQLRRLEDALGASLFRRRGRGLVLTDSGRVVLRYADEIFGLGQEMMQVVTGTPEERTPRLTVGVVQALPKLIAYRLLRPAMHMRRPVRVACVEDRPERLLAQLALHEIDLMLSDTPATPTVKVRAFTHLLGECGVSFFAAPDLARSRRRGFPRSLDGAPMLLPSEDTELRRSLEQWFTALGIRPRTVSEFDDSALLKVFGQEGAGIFAAPSAVEREIRRQYDVAIVGRTDAIRERFYAITVERRLTNPAVVAISQAARDTLFD